MLTLQRFALRYSSLLFIFGFFLCLQWHKIMHLAPLPDYIWDNIVLWDWARHFVYGQHTEFIANSHHMLRWGNWGLAAILIQLFSDDVFWYYCATLIPSTLAGLLFTYFAWRYIGIFAALVFCLMWYFDREIFRATFQLLPTGTALLPLVIALLLTTRILCKQQANTLIIISLAIVCFWLYGIKETYLAFAPGIVWVAFRYAKFKTVGIFVGVFLIGYSLETIFFHTISADVSWLGRLWMLLHDGHHVHLMFENPGLVAEQARYPDAGLTLRWITPLGITQIIFFPAFIFALLTVSDKTSIRNSNASANKAVAWMLLSFILFTTFFVISFSPFRLGQPLVSRYIAVGIPFAYLMIVYFCQQQFQTRTIAPKIALMMMLPFYFSHSYHRMQSYPNVSFIHHANAYVKFAHQLQSYDCIRSKNLAIVRNQLDLLPLEARDWAVSAIINNKKHIMTDTHWFSVPLPQGKCANPYSIRRTNMSRY